MASHLGRPHPAGEQSGTTGHSQQGVLARIGGLAVTVERGCIVFDGALVGTSQFGSGQEPFRYCDANGAPRQVPLPPGTFAFLLGSTLVVAHRSGPPFVAIVFDDGSVLSHDELILDRETSAEILRRSDRVRRVDLFLGMGPRRPVTSHPR
jgi:hypothetical protein